MAVDQAEQWDEPDDPVLDARQVLVDPRTGQPIPDLAALERRQNELIHRAGGPKRRLRRPEHLPAYVSDNRWVADCPHCGNGILVWHGQERAPCVQCGNEYAIDFPDERERRRAERIMGRRPLRNRHWFPQRGETVATLAAENRRHGVGVPADAVEDAADGPPAPSPSPQHTPTGGGLRGL